MTETTETQSKQLLHLVMGGRVKDPQSVEFADPGEIDVVGVFPSYSSALEAWRGLAENVPKAQQLLFHRADCNRAARRGEYDAATDAPRRA